MEIVLRHFARFSEASRLETSTDKSEVIFGGVQEEVRNQIVEVTGFKIGKLPMKYLGIPLSPNKLTKKECQQLVEKITSRIRGWMRKRLSYAGIIQLINSILLNMHIYRSSIILLPKAISQQVIQVFRGFLWGGDAASNRSPLVA